MLNLNRSAFAFGPFEWNKEWLCIFWKVEPDFCLIFEQQNHCRRNQVMGKCRIWCKWQLHSTSWWKTINLATSPLITYMKCAEDKLEVLCGLAQMNNKRKFNLRQYNHNTCVWLDFVLITTLFKKYYHIYTSCYISPDKFFPSRRCFRWYHDLLSSQTWIS